MKKLYTLLIISIWGCNYKGDDLENFKSEFPNKSSDYIKEDGVKKIREIHEFIYYYTNKNGKSYNETVSKFDLNGNLLSETNQLFDDSIGNSFPIPRPKRNIVTVEKNGYLKETELDNNGDILSVREVSKLNNNTVQETMKYLKDKIHNSVIIYTVDENNKVMSSMGFDKDSMFTGREVINYVNGRKITTGYTSTKEKMICEFKNEKFDKLGNWTEREEHCVEFSYYDKKKLELITVNKHKREFYYYDN
jgi:hypothetical protein